MKLSTDVLEENNWRLSIDIGDAKKAGQVISLAESTCIRMIEDIVGVDRDASMERMRALKLELRELRRQDKSKEQVRRIKQIHQEMSDVQFLPEYLCLVSENKTAFRVACRGFTVNGLRYTRLVGTPGGVKNSTVVFVAETARNGRPLAEELRRRIDNGRDMSKEFVPAKLEAYRALVCSASIPLSLPRGVLVVDDCVTHFRSDYILLKDGKEDEPEMSVVENGEVELVDSDGFGLMSPALARQWGYDLRLDYRPAGICLRNSFCKGMVFAFDFHEFAETVAGTYEVKDIWGVTHDIRNVDLVLTASMLKLWDSYGSIDEYLTNCEVNGHCFAATKATPKELDVERRLNYQFIQAVPLSDDDIWELVEPTVTELTDVMGDDYAKSLLFLRGTQLNEGNVWPVGQSWVAALMAEPKMLGDPYVRNQIKSLVKKKITESKFGKLKVRGNFSVISGDPFALCQSMWGMPVKGILKAKELYNRYWAEAGAKQLACFRAPMSSQHNIVKANVQSGWSASHWYQYMDTVTVLNAWDMTTHALNGADKDGDLIFLTDNRVIVDNVRDVLPIQCEQKRARKCVPTEADFVEVNALGFGDEIGAVTNRITAQTELQSLFEPGTPEYQELQYRITAGQHVQQNCIDKMKGVVSKPMPKHWYNDRAAADSDDPIDAQICASKKPYFMIYRYPEQRAKYLAFHEAAEDQCVLLFGVPIEQLDTLPPSEEVNAFREWYERLCPVQRARGVMNRICAVCENYFASLRTTQSDAPKFDPAILKSGATYSSYTKNKITTLYHEYMWTLKQAGAAKMPEDELTEYKQMLADEFSFACAEACPDEDELCDIVVDICYSRENSKQFAWDMCGQIIVKNLLARHDGVVQYPRLARQGDIVYGGQRFKLESLEVVSNEGYRTE